MTRSHSTGEKSDCHGRKCFEYDYGVKQKINGTHPFRQWFLSTTIGSNLTPGCEEGNIFSPGLLPPPLPYQSAQTDDTVNLPTVGQIWREGENQRGNG